jgi:hypothetical protein
MSVAQESRKGQPFAVMFLSQVLNGPLPIILV